MSEVEKKKAAKVKKPRLSKKIDMQEHEQMVGELTQDLQRIQADFANFKRRSEEDVQRAVSVGKESAVKQLLPTIDNVARALSNVPDDLTDNEYVKGVQAIAKQLDAGLENIGVHKIETVGAEFDADLMEAVVMEDGDGDREVVSEELQTGYTLGEQVLRYAVVKVKKEK